MTSVNESPEAVASDESEPRATDVVKSDQLTAEVLKDISNFEDALNALRANGITPRDGSQELGDGFVMTEKDNLINKNFVIMGYVFTPGDYDDEYTILRVVTGDGKFIITDGGTGIRDQLRNYLNGGNNPLGLVIRGLRKSEYDNEHGHGVTYYLNV